MTIPYRLLDELSEYLETRMVRVRRIGRTNEIETGMVRTRMVRTRMVRVRRIGRTVDKGQHQKIIDNIQRRHAMS
jgi:hypothetical protein